LLSVNECPVINWPLDMVVSMLKGEPGTWVRLTLQRSSWGGKTQFDVMVVREGPAPIHPHTVENMRRIPVGSSGEVQGAGHGLPATAAPRGANRPASGASASSANSIMDPLLGPFQNMNLVDGFNKGGCVCECVCMCVCVCVSVYVCDTWNTRHTTAAQVSLYLCRRVRCCKLLLRSKSEMFSRQVENGRE